MDSGWNPGDQTKECVRKNADFPICVTSIGQMGDCGIYFSGINRRGILLCS